LAEKRLSGSLPSSSAYVSQEDYQPAYVDMAPAVLPRVLEEFSMNIRFAEVEGYRLNVGLEDELFTGK
jgi:hypothetical protein